MSFVSYASLFTVQIREKELRIQHILLGKDTVALRPGVLHFALATQELRQPGLIVFGKLAVGNQKK
jgi:hypothetical protein